MDDLRITRLQAHKDTIAQIRETRKFIADGTNGCKIIISAGVDRFEEIGHNVSSRICSLDSLVVSVFNVRFGKGGKMEEHAHKEAEIIYVIDGSIIDLITGITTVEGNAYHIPPGKPHIIRSDYALLVVTFKPALQ